MYPILRNRVLVRAHVFRWRAWVEFKLWRRAARAVASGAAAAWRFAFRAELLRHQGAGRRPLRRHEFERIEAVAAQRGRWI